LNESKKQLERLKKSRKRGVNRIVLKKAVNGRYVVTHRKKGLPKTTVARGKTGHYVRASGSGIGSREQSEPRGPLFYGNDPTLAKRAEEELNDFGH
jgi:hypothetical protein